MKSRTLIICCILCLMAYLSFIFPVSIFAENEEELRCEESRIKGEMAGKEEHKGMEFLAYGFISGIFLPGLGPGTIVVEAANTHPIPSYLLNKETINEKCYRDGYSKAARKKNIYGALVGGLIGTAIGVTTFIVVLNSIPVAPSISIF